MSGDRPTEPGAEGPATAPAELTAVGTEPDWADELASLCEQDAATVPPDEADLAMADPDPDCGPPCGWTGWEALADDCTVTAATEPIPGGLGAGFTHADPPVAGSWPGGFAGGGVLDGMAPDPVLATFAWDACEAGIGKLTDDELIGLLLATRRLGAQQAAVELALVAELDGRRTGGRGDSSAAVEHVAAELAAALALTGRAADGLVGLARGLARLPGVWAALHDGRIDLPRARVFADELAAASDAVARACALAFTGEAGSLTTGQLRTGLRSLLLAIDPAAARTRAEHGQRQARVEAWAESSGNHALAGRELDPADALAADARITAIARALKHAGAPGTLDNLRAAVFAALLAGRDPESLAPATPPARHDSDGGGGPASGPGGNDGSAGHYRTARHGDDRAPDQRDRASADPAAPASDRGSPTGLAGLSGSVHLTMPLATWLGTGDQPGHAAGYGPADAPTCRDLAGRLAAAGRARWCLTLTGPDGTPAAHACAPPGHRPPAPRGPGPPRTSGPGPPPGTAGWLASLQLAWLEHGACTHPRQAAAYRPPARLAHLIRVRQRTCCFPGCRRPATACDLDHTIAHDHGGRTCECNLAPLCRRHHRAKQAHGWHLAQPEPGTLTWTLPHGRTYQTTGEPYPA
jgi:hypothetical protein